MITLSNNLKLADYHPSRSSINRTPVISNRTELYRDPVKYPFETMITDKTMSANNEASTNRRSKNHLRSPGTLLEKVENNPKNGSEVSTLHLANGITHGPWSEQYSYRQNSEMIDRQTI